LANFKIAETETFSKKLSTAKYRTLNKKLKDYVYPILRDNPYFGPNIKKLKGEYKELYRYRIGEYRIFYKVSEETVIVFILDTEARKDSYRK
jgi:mRNA interferase RelE/StbE